MDLSLHMLQALLKTPGIDGAQKASVRSGIKELQTIQKRYATYDKIFKKYANDQFKGKKPVETAEVKEARKKRLQKRKEIDSVMAKVAKLTKL